MKVIAQTAALQEALGVAGSIVISRSPKPVLACVKLVAADNTLTVLATDLEVGARYHVTAVKVEEPGEALVPADRLSGIEGIVADRGQAHGPASEDGRRYCPDRPPLFSSSTTCSMTMPRSTALSMS